MLTTILFDLDNTLILFDEAEFYYRYLKSTSEAFQDLIPKEIFKKRLMIASQTLLQNNGSLINSDYYMNVFCEGFEEKRDFYWNRFTKYYENGFEQLQQLMQPISGILELLNNLKQGNFKIVIASNPLFPLIVQLKRLTWAGFENFQFDLITHIENTKYCKPQLGYYLEICEQLNEIPENCLMVGNDPVNDMIASKVGMKTYLTTDSVQKNKSSLEVSQTIRKNHQDETGIKIDFQGPVLEVKKILKKLNGSN